MIPSLIRLLARLMRDLGALAGLHVSGDQQALGRQPLQRQRGGLTGGAETAAFEVVPGLVELEVTAVPPGSSALGGSVTGDPVKIEGGTAVKCNVPVAEAINDEGVLPERVQEALGQLVGAARDGLLALSVEVGLGVLRELLELEVDELVGPKGRWNPDRTAVRHGHEDGEVTLGGRRVGVKRPRARTADGEGEVPLVTYEHFADRDQLGDVVLERMLAGVSTRKYRRAQEPVGTEVETDARSTSKSAVSRTFVQRTRDQLWNLMNRPLVDMRLAVMMLDGIELHGRTNIVALGITTEGDKLALGLWDGSTENATVVAALLADLVDRGLDVEQGLLFVIDGSKALRKAVRQVFGNDVPVQRCVQHKECHEDGDVRHRGQPRGRSRPRGVPSCPSSSLGSTGRLVARDGVRSLRPAP